MNNNVKRLIRLVLVLFVIIGAILLLVWASKQSVIEISAKSEDKSAEVIISLDNGTDKQEFIVKPDENKKIRLKKGDYQIYAQQNSRAHLNSVKLGGFFKTIKYELALSPETNRAFLGDNPSECPLLIGELLVSTSCGGAYIDFRIHKPASDNTPSYVVEKKTANLGIIEGVISNKTGASLIARTQVSGGDELRLYRLNPSNNDLKSEIVGKIEGIESLSQINTRAYKNGYILYDEDISKIYFFETLSSLSPYKNISIEKPKSASLNPTSVIVKDDGWAILYADTPIDGNLPKKSEILLSSGEKIKLKDAMVGIEYCGNTNICGLTNNGYLVNFSANENGYKEARRMPGVVQISSSADNKLYILTDRLAAEYNAETGESKVMYSEGEYEIQDIFTESGIIVTIKGVDSKNRAIVLDPKFTDNNIDKLLVKLLKSDDVVFSIYKNVVFAALDLPPAPFNSNTGLFSHPDSFIIQQETKIRKIFDESGINKDNYRLVIPI
ncbi:MAG: hypothetical protein M3Q79_04515 [bacterium]|nr:hypothetical protein [bacterium]